MNFLEGKLFTWIAMTVSFVMEAQKKPQDIFSRIVAFSRIVGTTSSFPRNKVSLLLMIS